MLVRGSPTRHGQADPGQSRQAGTTGRPRPIRNRFGQADRARPGGSRSVRTRPVRQAGPSEPDRLGQADRPRPRSLQVSPDKTSPTSPAEQPDRLGRSDRPRPGGSRSVPTRHARQAGPDRASQIGSGKPTEQDPGRSRSVRATPMRHAGPSEPDRLGQADRPRPRSLQASPDTARATSRTEPARSARAVRCVQVSRVRRGQPAFEEWPGNRWAPGFRATAMLLTAVAASPNPVAISLTLPS